MVFTPPSVPPFAGDRNLRSEGGNRPTVLNFLPLCLSCKESSTSNQAFLLRRKDVTALRCSEPLRYKVGGASKPSPCCAGWDRLGKRVLSLKFIWFTACIRGILSIYCEFLGILEYADEFTTQSSFYTSNGLSREVMSAC